MDSRGICCGAWIERPLRFFPVGPNERMCGLPSLSVTERAVSQRGLRRRPRAEAHFAPEGSHSHFSPKKPVAAGESEAATSKTAQSPSRG